VLAGRTPLVIGVVLALGFLLLLVALQAPLAAALGVLTNLLAVGAAFGAARLIFQEGHGSGLLGFEPQGFLDAWAPVFFFAMIFAIGMDYTVFLLASAKEHWERTGDAREAMVGGLAHSGRVIFAAAGVMVAVFFTFALSGPLPPKEMGVVLGLPGPAAQDPAHRPLQSLTEKSSRCRMTAPQAPAGVGRPPASCSPSPAR
jgi:RND superfamily putative drug exporter